MSLTQINKAGLDEIALDHVFTIGASGSSAYTFQGEGLNGTVNNPTLYLTRGKTYRFENGSGGHPIRIQSTSGASGTAYNTGVTNNAGGGTVIVEVQHDAPDVLYYQCTSHAAMNGILYITGALADGGVTTAKLADDAVTSAKIADNTIVSGNLADSAITTGKIAAGAVTGVKIAAQIDNSHLTATANIAGSKLADGGISTAKIANNAVTTTKIADDQITTAKINDDAVTAAKLADSSVQYNHIATGSVLTAKINDGAVTTAKIANDAVTNAKIADNSINGNKLQDNCVATSEIQDDAIPESKLKISNSPTNGYFLSAQSGNTGGLTWAAVSTDLVSDTSPQLGGDLQTNGNHIGFADNNKARFGNGNDLDIFHDGSSSYVTNPGTNTLFIQSGGNIVLENTNGTNYIKGNSTGSAELYHNGSTKLETTSYGTKLTGYQSTTSSLGFYVRVDGTNNGFGTSHGSGITTYDVDYYSPIPMFNSRTVGSGNSYLQFPSYASGEYIKFTAPVAGVYMFELMCSWETHAGNDWLAVGWEKNTTSANSSGSLSGYGQYASGVFRRTSVDSGGPSHLQTIMWMDTNDYAVLYQQSCEAVRWGENESYVRGTLIN